MVRMNKKCVGWCGWFFLLLLSGAHPIWAQDLVSDRVGATAGQFRVDESGAATYSVPILAVPGTAGVTPQISLNYSSQGGDGPLGRGWSISGLSAISRCRATREAGDFISGGVPVDGTPPAINFTTTDRFCLDGQRLIPAPAGAPACPAVSGFTTSNLRTASEAFQRICAYTPSAASGNGPAFFSVERQDGSTSFYGNRDDWTTSATRPDGYVSSTAATHTAKALSWWQTRFLDSTGNYIDYRYTANPGGGSYPGESLLASIEYTGKKQLAGQSGGNLAPFAKLQFNYAARPATEFARGSVANGVAWQTRYLTSITSIGDIASNQQARFYSLGYGTSSSGSGARTLTSLTECRDSGMSVCLSPTTFAWSNASNSFSSADMVTTAGFSGLVSMRLGDVDGDGLTDVVWFKASGSNSELLVSFGELNASGQLTFNRVPQMSWTLGRSPADVDKYWHLFDYDGDGRDDLFVALPGSNANWVLYPSLGRPTGTGVRAFNLTNNLIATLSPAIPSSATSTILADFNGDGLLDVMYSDSPTGQGLFKTRLTERMGAGFGWGAQRSISMSTTLDPPMVENYQFSSLLDPGQRVHLNDFNGDSRSDLAISTTVTWFKYSPTPGDPCNIIPRPAEAISQWTDESGQVWSEWPASVEQALDPNERIRASCYKITRFVELYGVTNITPTSIQMGVIKQWHVSGEKWPDFPAFSEGYSFKFADFNGDGLTDVMVKNGNWYIDLTGVGTVQSGLALAVDSTTEKFIQLADVNGDGRADIVFPQLTNSNYRPFHGHIARPDGTFPTSASLLSSGNARGCKNATCNLANTYFMFSDFDGDGATDFVAIYDNSADHYSSRAPLASRYQPRDTITHITDGNGALTQLFYRPLTLADVYRRDTGARGVNWGRGSPVQELFGPQYVVVRAQSSAPVYNSTSSMSAVYYRYAGARVQAGGGGMLGFRQIQSIDTTAPGRHIVSTTSYRQDAPFAGVPLETVRRAVVGTYSATACMITTVTNACFQPPGAAFPAIGGTLLAQSTNVWESAPAFVPGTQRPVHIRLAGSDERVHALNNGALTSRVLSSFTHDGYGFATNTSVDTYSGGGSLVARVVTSNTYNHITSPWRLGRLSSSTVTHTRGGSSVSRSTSFTYDTSGAVTGQLLSERIQPGGGANQDLRTFHTLDAFGNRTHTYTCSNHLTEAACKGTAITFQPATATQVHRYARTVYDSRGRFPVASYSPYWNGSGAGEYVDTQILARNLFGDVTHARNVNGVDTMATYGTLGRPWYTWTEVVNTSSPGTPAAGVESWTTWRRCGTGTNQVPCPTGAVLRQQVITEGAPTQWSYHDVLGRVVLAASQTRHVGTTNKAFSGVCTAYDAAGRPARVSEPFFLTSTAAATEPATFASNVCTTARQWNLTTYDALGRVTALQRADGTGSTVTYNGLTTTTWDANGHATSQTTNALGEVVTSTDAVGLSLSFVYTPDGNIASVSRNAGRGAVTTSYVYDVLGRKTSQTDRDSGTISYQYNAVGEVISQTDAANHRIDNDLDARGRVWRQRAWRWSGSSHVLESTTTHVFDTLVRGALTSDGISGSTGTQSHGYLYDALGRLTQRDSTMDSRTYREQTAYDTLGRAWKSRDASGHWTKQEFDARGFATKTCASTAADTTSTCGSSFYTAVEQVDARGAVTLER
ncbi:MAG: FG-GAP-like repeat-containing protein, partial [Chiayiivirga sp.]|nr:FG-GAP-like repeat-containing protein [Chiayiivirga sp.]